MALLRGFMVSCNILKTLKIHHSPFHSCVCHWTSVCVVWFTHKPDDPHLPSSSVGRTFAATNIMKVAVNQPKLFTLCSLRNCCAKWQLISGKTIYSCICVKMCRKIKLLECIAIIHWKVCSAFTKIKWLAKQNTIPCSNSFWVARFHILDRTRPHPGSVYFPVNIRLHSNKNAAVVCWNKVGVVNAEMLCCIK